MKKLAVVLMVVGLFGAMPVLAAEHAGMKMDTKEGMRECAMQAESIQQKIARIEKEINEGSKKYSAKDLKKLKAKLKEANDTLDSISNESGYQR
jgi:mevalonate pyrophosphate decarboxylase